MFPLVLFEGKLCSILLHPPASLSILNNGLHPFIRVIHLTFLFFCIKYNTVLLVLLKVSEVLRSSWMNDTVIELCNKINCKIFFALYYKIVSRRVFVLYFSRPEQKRKQLIVESNRTFVVPSAAV